MERPRRIRRRRACAFACALVLAACTAAPSAAPTGVRPTAGSPPVAPPPPSVVAATPTVAPRLEPTAVPTVAAAPRDEPSPAGGGDGPERQPVADNRFPIEPADVADYGPTHHDYPATDIFAPCGTAVVSPVDGRVDEVTRTDIWDPAVDDPASRGGLSFSVVGDDGVRYYGSHLESLSAEVVTGARVAAGERIGTVGRSGNARPTPCHLHFGLSPPRGPGDWEVRRGVVPPAPYLDAWRGGDQRSPLAEVEAWAAANPAG